MAVYAGEREFTFRIVARCEFGADYDGELDAPLDEPGDDPSRIAAPLRYIAPWAPDAGGAGAERRQWAL